MAYTFDAGPNAVLIAHNRNAAKLLLQRLLFYFPPQSDTDLSRYSLPSHVDFYCWKSVNFNSLKSIFPLCLLFSSYVIGDKSILEDAGVHNMKDIEALAAPPEVKDNTPAQKYKGDVSYFICTRPGKGPVLLNDETKALLNAETGLPN